MSRKKKSQSSNQLEIQNAAKTLLANIRFMSPDSPIRTVAITSAVPNEGKTTCAIELARAMATSGKTVLLVEADMRRRSLASMLGVHPQAGVYSVLTDAVPIGRAVVPTSVSNLYFLDAEPGIPSPADILSSKRYRRLVSMLAEHYDYVVFDTPPVGTFVDAAVLSTLVDGVVLVARMGQLKRADLMGAYDQLLKAEANVLGVCATFCEGTGSEYYYAYYTQSGERVNGKAAAASASARGAADAGANVFVGGRRGEDAGGAAAGMEVSRSGGASGRAAGQGKGRR